MPKLVQCPVCGRKNPIDNVVCSNCGTNLDIAIREEAPNYPIKKIEEKGIENLLKELNLDLKKPKQKLSLEMLKPNETKLFLFINLVFTSLFLHLLVRYKIIFAFTFYPILYLFSCHWATKTSFDWQDFIFQFFLLILVFFFLFFLIPNYFISS